MARAKAADSGVDPQFAKYLEKDPTQLMDHIDDWIRTKTGVDLAGLTADDAFSLGVQLTVALRPAHQASEENQERLEQNRLAAERAESERASRPRAARASAPAATEQPEGTPAPKRRGRPPKATQAAESTPAPVAAPSGRRAGRRPAAAPVETAPDNVTQMPAAKRRGGRRKPAVATTGEAEF
jgi:hypothetical protein